MFFHDNVWYLVRHAAYLINILFSPLFQDVIKLNRALTNVVDLYCVPWDDFNHFDFLWANDVKSLINDRVIRLLQKFESLT